MSDDKSTRFKDATEEIRLLRRRLDRLTVENEKLRSEAHRVAEANAHAAEIMADGGADHGAGSGGDLVTMPYLMADGAPDHTAGDHR